MSQPISLKEMERKTFHMTTNDGLWDILLGCFLLIFAIGPLLSVSLGDFWSSAIFLPFWGMAYWGIQRIRKQILYPRIGEVKFGQPRKSKLKKTSLVMIGVNTIALILGILTVLNFPQFPGQLFIFILSFILLAGFSLAAYLLDLPRLYLYGLCTGLSPLAGEWLSANMNATHHGFPITFGITSGIILLTGLTLFVQLLINNPIPPQSSGSGEA